MRVPAVSGKRVSVMGYAILEGLKCNVKFVLGFEHERLFH